MEIILFGLLFVGFVGLAVALISKPSAAPPSTPPKSDGHIQINLYNSGPSEKPGKDPKNK
jgi:hypothetical protein